MSGFSLSCKIELCLARDVLSSFSKFKFSGSENSALSFTPSTAQLRIV